MRFLRTLISLGFLLFGAAVLVLAVGAYLTANGRSIPVMRTAVAKFGGLTAGQSTQQLALSISLEPAARHIEGVARLRIKAGESRRRIYLLLDDGLTVRSVRRAAADGERKALPHYRFWLVTAIDLGETLAAGDEVTLEIAYGGDPLAGISPFGQGVFDSDEILLSATDLWYPTDLKSFFRADVEITLPKSLTVVHSGTAEVAVDLGSSRRLRWTSLRPVPGVPLVAGRYDRTLAGRHGSDPPGLRGTGGLARCEHDPRVDGAGVFEHQCRLRRCGCLPSGRRRQSPPESAVCRWQRLDRVTSSGVPRRRLRFWRHRRRGRAHLVGRHGGRGSNQSTEWGRLGRRGLRRQCGAWCRARALRSRCGVSLAVRSCVQPRRGGTLVGAVVARPRARFG